MIDDRRPALATSTKILKRKISWFFQFSLSFADIGRDATGIGKQRPLARRDSGQDHVVTKGHGRRQFAGLR